MAKKHVDTCVGCTEMGLHCRGRACPNYYGTYEYTCDRCGSEFDPEDLYVVDGEYLCEECILGQYKTVAQEEEE